jgi:hypothetical protein
MVHLDDGKGDGEEITDNTYTGGTMFSRKEYRNRVSKV